MHFITIPENFLANVGANATTLLGDLTPVIAIILGIILAFFVLEWIVGFFMIRTKEGEERINHNSGWWT